MGPSNGQPKQVERYARTGRRASAAARQTSAYCRRESSTPLLMFRRLKVSDAAAKTATSSTFAASARSRPARVRHQRGEPDVRAPGEPLEDLGGVGHARHPAGADEGGHFDHGGPLADSRSTNAALSAAGTCAASFCRPSRGPTSTIRTSAGQRAS